MPETKEQNNSTIKSVKLNDKLFKASIKKTLRDYVNNDLRNHYGKALIVSSKLADIVVFKNEYVELNKQSYKVLLDKYNKSTDKNFQAKFGKRPYTLLSHLVTAISNVFLVGSLKTNNDKDIEGCLE